MFFHRAALSWPEIGLTIMHSEYRRQTIYRLLVIGFLLYLCGASMLVQASGGDGKLTIAMLHLELRYADLEHNAALVQKGIELASKHNAHWVMTPELSLTGYRFDLKLGTKWIPNGPDKYVGEVQALAKKHQLVVFLSHLEGIDDQLGKRALFNTLFVIDKAGEIIGRHTKVNTIPISESWSTAGTKPSVVNVDGYKVGLLICADAWPSAHANSLKSQGAELILSSASWAPGEYGPGNTWEKRSGETGLPIFVNNRTGIDRQFDLRDAVSAIAYQGRRLLSHQSPNSQLVIVNWDTKTNSLIDAQAIDIK
ncbi:MAG: putative amidohydrolase [Pseudohongiellaceae bacterium]|jgi:predicted amidohydrolase